MHALHAEWTKLRSLNATAWLLFATVLLSVAVSVAVVAATHTAGGEQIDLTKQSLTGIDLGQAVIAIFAIMTISEEYGTGMIRVSVTAMPRRLDLFVAKAANVTVLAFVAAVTAVGSCLIAGRLLSNSAGSHAAHDYTLLSLNHGPTLRAAVGTLVYLILIALIGLGIGTAVRDTGVCVAIVLGLLYVLPIMAQVVTDPSWHRILEQLSPMIAGLAIQSTINLASLPIRPWAGIGVVGAWAVASLILGGLTLRVRDA